MRNIGIIAHVDAGKTTFTERILYFSGLISRTGEVHEGATTMDFLPEEQERGITISSACITTEWNGYSITIIDTPGHVDFTIEVERSLRVLDGAIGIFCAVAGVQPQSEKVWKQANGFSLPRLAVINKMDKEGANFEATLKSIKKNLGVIPLALTIPYGEGKNFSGVIDIIDEKFLFFSPKDRGKTVFKKSLEEKHKQLIEPWRNNLLDTLTEYSDSDELLSLYLSDSLIPKSLLNGLIRKGTLECKFLPIYATSAYYNIGIQPVLDGITYYLPSPDDRPVVVPEGSKKIFQAQPSALKNNILSKKTSLKTSLANPKNIFIFPDPTAPFCGFAFKVEASYGEKSIFLRIYAGELKKGDTLFIARTGEQIQVEHFFCIIAGRRKELINAVAGQIISISGVEGIKTGDTLLSFSGFSLEPIRDLQPVISLVFEPKNTQEEDILDKALTLFCEEDPTLSLSSDGLQRVVSGMGELHLAIVQKRLIREFGIEPRIGNPSVIMYETPLISVEGKGECRRTVGSISYYGEVCLTLIPKDRGSGYSFHLAKNVDIDQNCFNLLQETIYSSLAFGPHGYPVTDCSVLVTSVKFGRCDISSSIGIDLATRSAISMALEQSGTSVIEPIMQLLITVPGSYIGNVLTLISSCNGEVKKIEDKMDTTVITAIAMMQHLFGFATKLRSVSQGRAELLLQFLYFSSSLN